TGCRPIRSTRQSSGRRNRPLLDHRIDLLLTLRPVFDRKSPLLVPAQEFHGETPAAVVQTGQPTGHLCARSGCTASSGGVPGSGPLRRVRLGFAAAPVDLLRGGCSVRTRARGASASRLRGSCRAARVGSQAVPRREGAPRTGPPVPQYLPTPGGAP